MKSNPINNKNKIEREHQIKNEFSYQQALLIGLLNQYCTITIASPQKKPVLTETLGRIINLEFQQENINIRNLTDTLCSMKYDVKEKEELKQKTLRRRYDKNKLIFIHNFIIDILVEKNYFFNFKLSKKSHKTLQFERIQEVFYKDKLLWNKDQLLLHGKLICKHISSQLNCNKDIVIHQNNNVIQNLLFKSPNINTLF